MTLDSPSEFAPGLLDDFYSECDEQLGTLRLLIEGAAMAAGNVNGRDIEALFRNMHSLKGNTAIVGLREAESLAHSAEDYLRALMHHKTSPAEQGIDVLREAVHRLEQTISAHRHRSPIPQVEDLGARLRELSSAPTVTSPGFEADSPSSHGGGVFLFKFVPSKELDGRGVNITSIRGRLAALGAIKSSAPLIGEGGSMAFEFVVETGQLPRPAEWETDGVTFAPAMNVSSISEDSKRLQPSVSDEALFIAPSHIVRVDISKLDDLLRIAGELVIHRSRLNDRLQQGTTDPSDLKEVNQSLTRSLRELREAITRVRLVPVSESFNRLPFVVRDLVRASDKKARLVVEGKHTEIDKYLVERIKEPLLHLVRNAVSHGLEPSADRVAAGKNAEGSISVQATAAGGFVFIKVRDDGRGIDPKRIAARAASLAMTVPEPMDDKAILDVICAPGFSTQESADRASGRGVGMNVVSDVIRDLGGSLSLASVLGKGTEFTLRLPLTLSIVEALIFSVAGQTCAVAQNAVQEIVEVSCEGIRTINKTVIMPYREGVLPVVHLARWFGDERLKAEGTKLVLVVGSGAGLAGLIVDRVAGQREVVVRPLEDPLIKVPGIAGATELGDGKPVLIVDTFALLAGAVRPIHSKKTTSVSQPAHSSV